MNMNYPTFHRKAGRCLKRESDTSGIEVQIPGPNAFLPLIHTQVTYPSKDRMDEETSTMELVNAEVYENYLGTLFQVMDQNRTRFNAIRQSRYDRKNAAA